MARIKARRDQVQVRFTLGADMRAHVHAHSSSGGASQDRHDQDLAGGRGQRSEVSNPQDQGAGGEDVGG